MVGIIRIWAGGEIRLTEFERSSYWSDEDFGTDGSRPNDKERTIR